MNRKLFLVGRFVMKKHQAFGLVVKLQINMLFKLLKNIIRVITVNTKRFDLSIVEIILQRFRFFINLILKLESLKFFMLDN